MFNRIALSPNMNKLLYSLLIVAFREAIGSSINQDCNVAGVNCVTSLAGSVNTQVQAASGSFGSSSIAGGSVGTVSPFGITLPQCSALYSERTAGFNHFASALDTIRNDVYIVQSTLTDVEASTQAILTTETGFSTKLIAVSELLANATERGNLLMSWQQEEAQVRTELSDLYAALDKNVLIDSRQLVAMTASLRNALSNMQTVVDKTNQIVSKVADAETAMYGWAYNVTSKVNLHTTRVVSLAQQTQFSINQVASQNIISQNLLTLFNTCKSLV